MYRLPKLDLSDDNADHDLEAFEEARRRQEAISIERS